MVRNPSCSMDGLNKGAWTVLEDKILTDYVKSNGEGRWSNVSKKTGLKRCGKSCRLRWMNYLRPDIKRGNISLDEEELIIRLHRLLGNRWSLIAGRLPGRTDNEIKNYWNTNLAKKAQDFRLEPKTIEKMTEENKLKSLVCQGDLISPHQHFDQNNNTKVVTIGSSREYSNLLENMVVESESSQRTSSLTSEEKRSSNFLMDFNIDDICEILDLGDVGIPDLNNVTQGETYVGESKLLSDELEENWSGSECVQGEIGNHFPSLASLLESDEWIGNDLNGVREIN